MSEGIREKGEASYYSQNQSIPNMDQSSSGLNKTAPDCKNCNVLREISHFNGKLETTIFSIHGHIGRFDHITISVNNGEGPAAVISYIDLRSMNHMSIKTFIVDYLRKEKENGSYLLEDYISPFCGLFVRKHVMPQPSVPPSSEILHLEANPSDEMNHQITIEPNASSLGDDDFFNTPEQTSTCMLERAMDQNANVVQPLPRSRKALQMEKISKMEFDDIKRFFHVPLVDAARDLGICTTALKNRCRKLGIPKWPYRKINAIGKKANHK